MSQSQGQLNQPNPSQGEVKRASQGKESQPKVESQPKIQSQAQVQSQAAVKSQAQLPSQGVIKSQAQMQSQGVIKSQAQLPSQAALKSQAQLPSQAALKSQAQLPSQAALKSQAQLPSQAALKSQAQLPSQAQLQSQAALKSQAQLPSQGFIKSQAQMRSVPIIGPATPPPEPSGPLHMKPNKVIVTSPEIYRPVGPYSQAVLSDKTLYVSGVLGLDKDAKLVCGGAAAEARKALDNLQHVLEAGGSSLEAVLKTTILLNNIEDFQAVNQVYAEYFTRNYPARATYQVGRLPLGAAVEIEAIAISGFLMIAEAGPCPCAKS